ncbi:hypothetical protein PROSTU_02045 [Providencia stuartii ATCC 25827]|uniref:Uncharacterized protein n=1 Tax=Providencia stuartii ATCC 25827 TaxID=471874 RepID=A0AA86YUS3_PROST|nr:hypothetical protein PROSTU_02045 [Providencia stuartii ATCC 25827]
MKIFFKCCIGKLKINPRVITCFSLKVKLNYNSGYLFSFIVIIGLLDKYLIS